MIRQKLRKVGNSYVVTIPRDEVERHELREGDLVGLEIAKLEVRHVLPQDVAAAFDASWRQHEAGYRYLAGE